MDALRRWRCVMWAATLALATTAGASTPQYYALEALYHTLHGPWWHHCSNWLSTEDPCNASTTPWYGVGCTEQVDALGNSSMVVTDISLGWNGLVGPMHALSMMFYTNLTHLQTLDLDTNSISGKATTMPRHEVWCPRACRGVGRAH